MPSPQDALHRDGTQSEQMESLWTGRSLVAARNMNRVGANRTVNSNFYGGALAVGDTAAVSRLPDSALT